LLSTVPSCAEKGEHFGTPVNAEENIKENLEERPGGKSARMATEIAG